MTGSFTQAITNGLNFIGRSILTVFKGDFHDNTANHVHRCSQFKTNAMNLCSCTTPRESDKNGKLKKKKKVKKITLIEKEQRNSCPARLNRVTSPNFKVKCLWFLDDIQKI